MKKILTVLAVLAAAPLSLAAQELNYNYIEAGLYRADISGLPNADGAGVAASAALGSNFQLFGEWSKQEFDSTNLDFDRWRVGVGYRYGLGASTDLLARAAYEKVDLGSGLDADGYTAEVGVRSALAPKFEAWALAGYGDANNGGGDFYGRLGAQFKFTPQWGLTAEAVLADDANTLFVGPRFSF